MVVNSIAAPPEPKRDAAARKLLPTVKAWSVVTLRQAYGAFPAGTVLRAAPASKPIRRSGRLVTHYLVNNLVCECPDYAERMYVCKHVRAIMLYEESLRGAPMPKTYRELFGVCAVRACDEDRLPHEEFCEQHVNVDAF